MVGRSWILRPARTPVKEASMPYKDTAQRAEYQRQYRQRNRAKRVADRPDYDRTRHANKRAKKYGCSGIITIDDVRLVMQVGRCHYCGISDRLGIDHVVPLHAGGLNAASNLVCCCHSCNARKRRKEGISSWSEHAQACLGCGETERKHEGRGYCSKCYLRIFPRKSRAKHDGGAVAASHC